MNGAFTSQPQNTLPPPRQYSPTPWLLGSIAGKFNLANACVVSLSGDEEEA
jgi:hypothetical protein